MVSIPNTGLIDTVDVQLIIKGVIMKMSSFFAVIVLVVAGAIAGQTCAWGGDQTRGRGGYNYPHEVPADYVYRTERVFAGQESKSNWLASVPAFFKRKDAYVAKPYPAEHGSELRLQVGEIVAQLLANSRESVEDGDRGGGGEPSASSGLSL